VQAPETLWYRGDPSNESPPYRHSSRHRGDSCPAGPSADSVRTPATVVGLFIRLTYLGSPRVAAQADGQRTKADRNRMRPLTASSTASPTAKL